MNPSLISDYEGELGVEVWSADELLVHNWRLEQLQRLGLAAAVAEAFAELVDWHDVESLVARGCPASLALEILR